MFSFMVFSRKTTYSAGVLEQRFAWSTPNKTWTSLYTSLPNINLLGVKPELWLTVERIALLIWGKYRSQSQMFLSWRQRVICNTVLFMHSIWQFEHGRYPVVWVLVICNNSQRTVKKLLMKSFPWSVWSSKQRPNLEKNSSTMVFATNLADWWQVMDNTRPTWWTDQQASSITVLPLGVLDNGPKISIMTRSIRAPAWYCPISALRCLLGFLLVLHFAHAFT